MLNALIAGERDPAVLADLARTRMRRKIPALTEALTGHFDDGHASWRAACCTAWIRSRTRWPNWTR
jgi:hypothetical protein